MTTAAPFDATPALAALPFTLLALLALVGLPALAYVARRRRRARADWTWLACHGSAAPGGCLTALGGGVDCGAACALNGTAEEEATPDGCWYPPPGARFWWPDSPAEPAAAEPLGGGWTEAGYTTDGVQLDDTEPEPEPASVTITADGMTVTGGTLFTTLTGEPLTGTVHVTTYDPAATITGATLTPDPAAFARPMHDQTARIAVGGPSHATDRTGPIAVPPYLRDPEPADAPPEADWTCEHGAVRGAGCSEFGCGTLPPAAAPTWDADGYAPRPWADNAQPSPTEWADWFVACAPHAQTRIARHVQEAFDARHRCFQMNHDRLAERAGDAAEIAESLRMERATLQGEIARITRARHRAEAACGEADARADRAIAANGRLIIERDAARRAEHAANVARREDRHALIDMREELAAAQARATDAEHDHGNALDALTRARDNHATQYDRAERATAALQACEAAYAASVTEWAEKETRLRRALDGVTDVQAETLRDLAAARARAEEAEARAADLAERLADAEIARDAHRETIGNLLDAARLARERGNGFRDRYNEAATEVNALRERLAAPPTATTTVRINGDALRGRIRDLLAAEYGVPSREEARALLDAREADEDAHRHARAQVADARHEAAYDLTTGRVQDADDLPEPPEPVGTAAEWLARLEEWHAADQHAAGERETVETSRGLTYPAPVERDELADWSGTWSRTVETIHTPAYAVHATVAETAAGA